MPADRRLYRCHVPIAATRDSGQNQAQNVQMYSPVGGGSTSSETISTQPGTTRVRPQFRGYNARKLARELIELVNSDQLTAVPYYGVDDAGRIHTPDDGYYSLESAGLVRNEARVEQHIGVNMTLREVGTKRNHWREMRVKQTQPRNDFGNDTTAYIGVPAAASKLRWFNSTNGSRETPSLVSTRSAEHGDVEMYDFRASSLTNPTMIYELPYVQDGRTDPKVWDTRGNSSKTSTPDGSNTVIEWQRVFDPAHDEQGKWVFDNGLIRVYIDDSANTISAETYSGSWGSVSLTSNSWEPFDVDVYHIGQARVDARVEFYDTSGDTYFDLDMSLQRGYNYPQWTVPDSGTQGSTPSGLQDVVDNIANGDAYDPNPSIGVIDKAEVRR